MNNAISLHRIMQYLRLQTGCTNIEKPFWGEACPVENCCQAKGYAHCGLCPYFACELLHQFAYDKKQVDNGLRLQQCQKWAQS